MSTDIFLIRITSHKGKKGKDTFPWIQIRQLRRTRKRPALKLKIQESGYVEVPIKLAHDYPIRQRLGKVARELGDAILKKSVNVQIYSNTVKRAP